MQCAATAAQVFIERCKVWSKVLACAGGPHEEPEGALKLLARDFLGFCESFQLVSELCELACHQMQRFDVQMEGPSAPCDAVAQLRFLPADGCIDGSNEERQNDGFLLPGCLREHGEQVIDAQPRLVAILAQKCVRDAQELASDTLPTVCSEFCPEMAHHVVVEFGFHLE